MSNGKVVSGKVSQKDWMDARFAELTAEGKTSTDSNGALVLSKEVKAQVTREMGAALFAGQIQCDKRKFVDEAAARSYASSAVYCRLKRGKDHNGGVAYYDELKARQAEDPSLIKGSPKVKKIAALEAEIALAQSPAGQALLAKSIPEADVKSAVELIVNRLQANIAELQASVATKKSASSPQDALLAHIKEMGLVQAPAPSISAPATQEEEAHA